jgi:serine/threonine-protein kinase
MRIGLWVWPSFTLLDVYMCLVLYRDAPLPVFLAIRLLVEGAILQAYRLSLRPMLPIARVAAWQNASYLLAAFGIAIMALMLGGARSPYMHGISIVCLVRAAVIPEPWHDSRGTYARFALIFPAVLAVAALVSSGARQAWLDMESLGVFAANYVFVLASAIVGMASGHSVWAAHEQLYRARRLGRYRLQAPLGKGDMGEVWLAWDDSLKRNVALKILRTEGPPDYESVRLFEREALSASRLRVPHTIQVFDFGASDDGVYYIAMEYLPGLDLRRLVDQHGPLAPARAVRFVAQACRSLEEAHAAGITHRDIKPQNLFVTRVGDDHDFLKLLDFGIAQFTTAEDGDEMTRSSVIRGTPAFLAPEIWQGRKADARSDIYALGTTLYFLLTGGTPFGAGTTGGLLRAHAEEDPVPPSDRRQEPLPDGLDAIVMRCLAKDPKDRYQSASDLRAALEGLRMPEAWTPEDARTFWRKVNEGAPARPA